MRPRELAFDEIVQLVGIHCHEIDAARLSPALGGSVVHLPDWVREYGLASSPWGIWLWTAPSGGHEAAGMGQATLDLPGGRYVVDALDTVTGAWISREVGTAPPLVIGLPRRNGPVLLRIVRQAERRGSSGDPVA